jgi:peptidoglycan/LPS O-acetylase OafA/YrhL
MAQERAYQLDVIRALGLTAVVFQHTMNPNGPLLEDLPALALTLFFALSGFLITGILLDARERATAVGVSRAGVLGRFYIRRFLRIFPIYYATIAVAVLLGEPATRQYLLQLVTYQTNFLLAGVGHNIAPITPLWSLAVEEHFYAFWPLVALFASRRMRWVWAVVMVVTAVVSRGYQAFQGAPFQTITLPTYAALDGIAIGCMLAMAWRETTQEQREPWIQRALLVGSGALLLRMTLMFIGGYRPLVHTLHMLPFALVSVWIVDRGARDMLPRLFNVRWLADVGVISYGAYVMHRYVMHYLGFDAARGPKVFASVLLVSVGLAAITWRFFESPLNNLKRFWPYVPRPTSRGIAPGASTPGVPLAASDVVEHGHQPSATARGS